MAFFKDTVPMNDTISHDSLVDLNKTIQDSLFESMAEFMYRTGSKDTGPEEEARAENNSLRDTSPKTYLSESMDGFMRRTAPTDAGSEAEAHKENDHTKDTITRSHLYESMKEFMERTSIKDSGASEVSRADDRINDIESDFAKDFGFNEVEFLKANTERFLEEYAKLDDVDSIQVIETLREAEFANLYKRFSDDLVYTEWGEGPNCYAFAMDMTVNPITGKVFSTRPTIGEISGNELPDYEMMDLLMYGDEEQVKSVLVDLWSKDCEAMGKELIEVSSGDYVPKEGETLTALMYGNDTTIDFHFMRKGDYGRWYHKPGALNPTTYDNSGRFIQDPKDCDRGIYNHFCGYFVIRDKEVAV